MVNLAVLIDFDQRIQQELHRDRSNLLEELFEVYQQNFPVDHVLRVLNY